MNAKRLAIIGAGPIGLEAALRAINADYDVTIYEHGTIADNVRAWGHVTLFSPFGMNRSDIGLAKIQELSDVPSLPDDEELITGKEYADRYLTPLSQWIAQHASIQLKTRVVAITCLDLLKHEKIGNNKRADAPFRLLLQHKMTGESTAEADIIIDASGTYGHHCWLGNGGIPAVGERSASSRISYLLDDPLGRDISHYAGKRVLLVGSGYSAATSIIALVELRKNHPDTEIHWLVRRPTDAPIPIIENDRLPQRLAIAEQANKIAAGSDIKFLHGFVDRIDLDDDRSLQVTIATNDGSLEEFVFDRILANVGYSPDNRIYRELQVHECYATLGPMNLAASLMDAPTADCLDQQSPGADALINPEPNFYILGSKSFGRNSAFLIRLGLDQIDQLFTETLKPIA